MADKLFKVSTKDTYSSVCSLLDKGWVVKDMKPDAEGGYLGLFNRYCYPGV